MYSGKSHFITCRAIAKSAYNSSDVMMTITSDPNIPYEIFITSLITICISSNGSSNVFAGHTTLSGTTKEIIPIYTSAGKAQDQILAFFVYSS